MSRYDPLDLFAGVGATAAAAAAAPAVASPPGPAAAATAAADTAAHATGAGDGDEGAMSAFADATGVGAKGAGAEGARAESGAEAEGGAAGDEGGAAAEGPARARRALLALVADPQNNMCVRRADRPGVAFGHGATTQTPPPKMERYDDGCNGPGGGGDDDIDVYSNVDAAVDAAVDVNGIPAVDVHSDADAGWEREGRWSLAWALDGGFCPAVMDTGIDEPAAEAAVVDCFLDVVAWLVPASHVQLTLYSF